MSQVKVTMQGRGRYPRTLHDEELGPVEELCSTPNGPRSKIGFTLSKVVGPHFVKVAVFVELECDQQEQVLDRAAAKAFYKALEYQRDGLSVLEAEGEI